MRLQKIILAGTLACIGAIAQAVPPATQPSEIDTLIHQLGDENYTARRSAIRRLREIGKPAVPALQEALKSDDPEIHFRADELIEEFQRPPIPVDTPQPPVAGNGGFYQITYREQEHDGIRIVDATEGGRSIHIERYPTGVIMTISGQIAGRPATRTYRFHELADLRRANPQAYVVYMAYIQNDNKLQTGMQVHVQAGGGFIRIVPGMGQGGMPIVPLPPMIMRVPARNDQLDRLEQRLLDQMRQQQIPPAQQDKVTGLLRQMKAARPAVIEPLRINEQFKEFNRLSDELRNLLQELKLPDPGPALPRVGTK